MNYLPRLSEDTIRATLDDGKIAILYGPRQVGKTTLSPHIAHSIDPSYRYWNCDEPDVAQALSGKTSTELGRILGTSGIVVIDEAQNCTYVQLKMLLTRLGWHSTMVVTGDPNQSDLLPELSGLGPVADRLQEVGNIAVVRLAERDIVRHPLVARIVDRARRGRLPLLDGGRALIDSTYVDNAATGIVAALHCAPEAHGRAFVITNGEPRPVGELLAGI